MLVSHLLRLIVLMALMPLAGCGGGSSGGASPVVSFDGKSWQSITYPSVVEVTGKGYEGTYSITGGSADAVNAARVATSPKIKLTYNSSGALTSAVLSTNTDQSPVYSPSYDSSQSYDRFVSANANDSLTFYEKSYDVWDWALATEPTDDDLNWRYQSIGIWTDPDGMNGIYGAITVGSETPDSGIPASGTVTFNGAGGGFYQDTGNDIHVTQASVTAVANFASRSISISSTGTFRQEYNQTTGNFGSVINDSNLNFTGTLTYSSGTNDLSGTITTSSGLTGPSIGSFYGPDANEIGAAFNLTGGGETFVGAFGAK